MKDITPEIFLKAIEAMAGSNDVTCKPDYDFETWLEESGVMNRRSTEEIKVMKCPQCRHFTYFSGTINAICACCRYEGLHNFSQESFSLDEYYRVMFEDEDYCWRLFNDLQRTTDDVEREGG